VRARGAEPLFTSADQDVLLDRIAATALPGAVGVFDLDGCLFDNRPRQIRILRELASREDLPELYRVEAHHFCDWSLAHTFANAGVDQRLVARALEEWERRFFTSDFVRHDHAMPGAAALVRACYGGGMRVIYFTGRDDSMRPGTEEALDRFGFPFREAGVRLVTKPNREQDDVAFKTAALEHLGPVHLYVDNEPANVNVVHARHPDALVVFFESDHSDRPDEPHPDIPWLRSFLRTSVR
jgi:phosphoglycolate phosphatase-like HAD superfamily hydrolase